MPKLLENVVQGIMREHPEYDKSQAYAIATAQLQKNGYLKEHTQQLTAKGRRRENTQEKNAGDVSMKELFFSKNLDNGFRIRMPENINNWTYFILNKAKEKSPLLFNFPVQLNYTQSDVSNKTAIGHIDVTIDNNKLQIPFIINKGYMFPLDMFFIGDDAYPLMDRYIRISTTAMNMARPVMKKKAFDENFVENVRNLALEGDQENLLNQISDLDLYYRNKYAEEEYEQRIVPWLTGHTITNDDTMTPGFSKIAGVYIEKQGSDYFLEMTDGAETREAIIGRPEMHKLGDEIGINVLAAVERGPVIYNLIKESDDDSVVVAPERIDTSSSNGKITQIDTGTQELPHLVRVKNEGGKDVLATVYSYKDILKRDPDQLILITQNGNYAQTDKIKAIVQDNLKTRSDWLESVTAGNSYFMKVSGAVTGPFHINSVTIVGGKPAYIGEYQDKTISIMPTDAVTDLTQWDDSPTDDMKLIKQDVNILVPHYSVFKEANNKVRLFDIDDKLASDIGPVGQYSSIARIRKVDDDNYRISVERAKSNASANIQGYSLVTGKEVNTESGLDLVGAIRLLTKYGISKKKILAALSNATSDEDTLIYFNRSEPSKNLGKEAAEAISELKELLRMPEYNFTKIAIELNKDNSDVLMSLNFMNSINYTEYIKNLDLFTEVRNKLAELLLAERLINENKRDIPMSELESSFTALSDIVERLKTLSTLHSAQVLQ